MTISSKVPTALKSAELRSPKGFKKVGFSAFESHLKCVAHVIQLHIVSYTLQATPNVDVLLVSTPNTCRSCLSILASEQTFTARTPQWRQQQQSKTPPLAPASQAS